MTKSLQTVALLAVLGLSIAACGGSDSSESDAVDVAESVVLESVVEEAADSTEAPAPVTEAPVPVTQAPPVTEAAPATEAPPVTEAAPVTEAPPVTEPGGSAEVVAASMVEWSIDAPTEYAAGEITFAATNNGSFPHEFVVIEGESYESLPRAEGGAVIEDELPTGALIGRTSKIGGGSVEDLTVTLGPGNYVLLCNLGGGNSHAARGQRLEITVS
jgi:hypothetical protein